MNSTIWKYALGMHRDVSISMPVGANILSVGAQKNEMFLWALVNPTNKPVYRDFVILGTGHTYEGDPGKFIGTIHLHNSQLIFHVFERGK